MTPALTRILCGAIFACVIYLLSGCDADSAEVTSKIVKEVDEKKITFTHPLEGCTAWNAYSGIPGEMARPLCYYPRSQR